MTKNLSSLLVDSLTVHANSLTTSGKINKIIYWNNQNDQAINFYLVFESLQIKWPHIMQLLNPIRGQKTVNKEKNILLMVPPVLRVHHFKIFVHLYQAAAPKREKEFIQHILTFFCCSPNQFCIKFKSLLVRVTILVVNRIRCI